MCWCNLVSSLYWQVLPLARKHFGPKRQRELLYQSLCVMPLKLIECVLPWLVASLSEEEARSFLQNMHMAGLVLTLPLILCYYLLELFSMLHSFQFGFISNFQSYVMQLQHQIPHWLHFFLVGHAKVILGMCVCL